jgi:hypothetical protein
MKIKIRRTGEKVTIKEFYKRWKQGMKDVTPYQQCLVNQIGYLTVFIGIIWGIIYSLMLKQYWLSIILIGSLIVSSTAFLANWQKKTILKKIEDTMKGIENE